MISQEFQYNVLLSNSFIDITFYQEGFLHVNWKGYLSVGQVQEGCELILRTMLTQQCFLSINDNRAVKGSWTQAIKWLEMNFMPRLVESGVQKIAFLYAQHQSARYSVDRLLEVNDQYYGQTFDDFKQATNWLMGKPIEENTTTSFILIKTLNNYSKISLVDIYYISTNNGQTLIKTLNTTYTTRKTLTNLLTQLPQPQFFRIHKSHIVNTNKIKSLKYHAGGYYHLFLKDFGKIYLTVSRNYVKELKILLNLT